MSEVIKKYQVILADPPWRFGSRGIKNGKFQKLETEYATLSIKEIADLPVRYNTDTDAVLFLWVTSAHLLCAQQVIEAWGFKYVRIDAVWDKVTSDGKRAATVGPWGMNDVEVLLFATKGTCLKYQKVNNLFQHVTAIRAGHSEKPEVFRRRIEQRFPTMQPRLEMFARRPAPAWDVWGLEAPGSVPLMSNNWEVTGH